MILHCLLVFALTGAVVTQKESKFLPYIDDIFQYVQKSNENYFQEGSATLRKLCERSGKLEDLPRAERALQDAVDYWKKSFNVSHLVKEIQKADTQQKAWELFCNIKSSLLWFNRKMLNTSELCLSASDKEGHFWQGNLWEAFADSVCTIDSQKFERYINVNETECIEKKAAAIQTCHKENTKDLVYYGDNIFGFFYTYRFYFKEHECSQILDLQTCVTPVIEECSPGVKMIEILFNDIRRALKCKIMIGEDNETETKNVLSKSSKSLIQDVTSAHFSKIIEIELSDLPKKKRINSMKGMLEVLEAHII